MNTAKLSFIVFVLFMALVVAVVVVKNNNNRSDEGKQELLSPLYHMQKELVELGFFPSRQMRTLLPMPLAAMDGSSVILPNVSEQWQLVNFGYMFCPDICPVNLRLLSDVKKNWDGLYPDQKVTITHLTFDPERDTPDRLQAYLAYINPDIIGLTGELDNVRQVARQLNMAFTHDKPDEYGNYFISHTDSIALLNPQGQYVGLFKGPYQQENVIKVLERVIK